MSDSTTAWALRTTGLHKTYRRRRVLVPAVDRLDLNVPAGGVHGFLGPNGSGKTTTIRMVLGLIRADAGRMEVFGTEVPRRLPEVVDRVGAIVEQPKFFPSFSARRNLELLATGIGVPAQRVGAVLEEVGLGQRARDRYKTYSLGMKQRLAIAATLLKDPDLLIFDEPTNGLDPAGIHAVRQTMRHLAYQGKTVLVSSHILAEVQQVADTVSIIGRGRLLAEGRVDDILATGVRVIRVRVPDPATAHRLLVESGFGCAPTPDGALSVTTAPDGTPVDASGLNRFLAARGVYASELIREQANLEQVFLQLTAGQALGSAPPGPPPAPPGAESLP
ncbi:MAG TPA: ATP-binding cassette domain-containing protein [Microlunatus sp.]